MDRSFCLAAALVAAAGCGPRASNPDDGWRVRLDAGAAPELDAGGGDAAIDADVVDAGEPSDSGGADGGGADGGTSDSPGCPCVETPAPRCVDGVATRFEAPGLCVDGACAFTATETLCPAGCVDGACLDVPPRPPRRLWLGTDVSCRSSDVGVTCAGVNELGQLGDGTTELRTEAVPVLGLGAAGGPRDLGGVGSETCALEASGAVLCWGSDDGRWDSQPTPTLDASVPGATSIAMGNGFGCALDGDGAVRCWGYHRIEGLPADAPEELPLPPTAQLATTRHSACALDRAGIVRCWGSVSSVGVGDPAGVREVRTPTPVSLPAPVAELASGGSFVCARDALGDVWCWGYVPGLGPDDFEPQRLDALESAVALVAGHQSLCARGAGGRWRCGGKRFWVGALSARSDAWPPQEVPALDGAVEVALGAYHACARYGDGSVRCLGDLRRGAGGIDTGS